MVFSILLPLSLRMVSSHAGVQLTQLRGNREVSGALNVISFASSGF